MSKIDIDIEDVLVELIDGDNRPLPSKVIQHVPNPHPPMIMTNKTDEQVIEEVESNLREVIEYGREAVKNLSDLASQSEHPRPYEALSTLIRAVSDTNMNLASLRKKDKGPERKDGKFQEPEARNGHFTASVSDLLDELDKKAK